MRYVRGAGLVALSMTALVAVASCGGGGSASKSAEVNPAGDIPDTQAFVVFSPAAGGYRVKVPEGWARTGDDRAVMFSEKLNLIGIELRPALQPNVQSVVADAVPGIRARTRNFRLGTVSVVSRPAGSVVLVKYAADSPPDSVTGRVVRDEVERYSFWHGGTEAILTLTSPHGADNVDPWRTVTDSFEWTS